MIAVLVFVAAVQQRSGEDLRTVPRIAPATVYELVPFAAGTAFSTSDIAIRDSGEDIEVLDIIPLMSANVDFLGAVAIWPRDLQDYGAVGYTGPGFPGPDQQINRPAIGTVVPAAEMRFVPEFLGSVPHLTIPVGFRIREGNRGAVNGLVVVYRRGDDIVREHIRSAIIACVKPVKNCAPGRDTDAILRELGLIES
ncbi:MAG: hypothetical protein ACT4P1_10365 [Sporichthyaceae bacterium]